MDRLPFEIIERITRHYLDTSPHWLAHNLLLVSPLFRAAVEAHSGNFQSIFLSGEHDLAHFRDLFSKRSRAKHLQHLSYTISCPDGPRTCWTNQDLQNLSRSATNQISALFHALHALETHPNPSSRPTPRLLLELRTELQACRRLSSTWRIQFLPRSQLPHLYSVTRFSMPDPCYPECLDSTVVAQLLPCLPNLQLLHAAYLHDESSSASHCQRHSHVHAGPRRDSRHAFARTMNQAIRTGAISDNITFVMLRFGHPTVGRPQDQAVARPNLAHPIAYDPLSDSLRRFSKYLINLNFLELVGCFDSSLLVPPPSLPGDRLGEPTCWPNLKTLRIVLFPDCPDGTWYFRGSESQEGDEGQTSIVTKSDYPTLVSSFGQSIDDTIDTGFALGSRTEPSGRQQCRHSFRTRPVQNKMESFLLAWGEAMARMPMLRRSSLWCPLRQDWEDDFGGNSCHLEACDSAWGISWVEMESICQAVWMTEAWRPGQAVLDELERAWRRQGKPSMMENRDWLPELRCSSIGNVILWPDFSPDFFSHVETGKSTGEFSPG